MLFFNLDCYISFSCKKYAKLKFNLNCDSIIVHYDKNTSKERSQLLKRTVTGFGQQQNLHFMGIKLNDIGKTHEQMLLSGVVATEGLGDCDVEDNGIPPH